MSDRKSRVVIVRMVVVRRIMITKIQNTDNYSYRYANFFMGGQARLTFLCQVQSMRKTKLTFPAFIQHTALILLRLNCW